MPIEELEQPNYQVRCRQHKTGRQLSSQWMLTTNGSLYLSLYRCTDTRTSPQIGSIDEVIAVAQLAGQQLIKPKIVALGGGTGLAVLLKELRKYPADLTAVVTVFDSGRHSGALRKYLGILPPGDIRNCLVALSDSDEVMSQLMNYRFKENFMEGCSLGNLLLAALTDIHGGFDNAVTSVSDILNVHGRVLPATLESTELCAELEDGSVVVSEVNVRSPVVVDAATGEERPKAPIKRVFLANEHVAAFLPAVKAIESADIIVLSPGGFYTSIIATLLVPGIRDAIRRSAGATVYISNVATQCGQTDGYTLSDTVDILGAYLGDHAIDYVVANNAVPHSAALAPYFARGEQLLLPTREMAARPKPVLLQGRTFEEVESSSSNGTVAAEWNKTRMIKHSGEMVVAMLYQIIDRELEGMKSKLLLDSKFHPRIPLTPRGQTGLPMTTTTRRGHQRAVESAVDGDRSSERGEKEKDSATSKRSSVVVLSVLVAVVAISTILGSVRSRR